MALKNKLRSIGWNLPVGVQMSVIYAVVLAGVLTLLGFALYSQLDKFMVQNTADRLNRFTQPVLARPFFGRDQEGPYSFPLHSPAGHHSTQLQATSILHRTGRPQLWCAPSAVPTRPLPFSPPTGSIITSTQATITSTEVYLPALPADWKSRVDAGNGMAQWEVSEPGHERSLVVVTRFVPIFQGQQSGAGTSALDAKTPQTTTQSGIVISQPDEYYIEQIASLGAADDI